MSEMAMPSLFDAVTERTRRGPSDVLGESLGAFLPQLGERFRAAQDGLWHELAQDDFWAGLAARLRTPVPA